MRRPWRLALAAVVVLAAAGRAGGGETRSVAELAAVARRQLAATEAAVALANDPVPVVVLGLGLGLAFGLVTGAGITYRRWTNG